ncbi:MAG: hypothetical protein J2P21_14240, partial [Chloracidobacterium sp.]|nr:hypothetical protein [Chloracidobacterium sp.]
EPTKPMQPGVAGQAGKIERQEYEYVRHGTQCLIANFEVATANKSLPALVRLALSLILLRTSIKK